MVNMGREEDRLVRIVDDFCNKHCTEKDIRQWCMSRGVPDGVYRAFYASEVGSLCFPLQAGGRPCSFYERSVVVARLMRRVGATLPFLSDMVSMALLSTMRELSQREIADDLVPRNGRVCFSQAFSETTAGSDASAVLTAVTADFDGLFLNGEKTFVSNGQFAPSTLVLASDPICGRLDGGLSLWLIPIDAIGVSSYPLNTLGQEMLAPAMLVFDQVHLSPEWQIQTEGMLDSMLKREYELGRILVCASSMGLAQAALDDALEHAATHMVKGRRLGSLPQIQEKLADMEVSIRSMQRLIEDAAHAVDAGGDSLHLDAALMKRFVPKAATEVASEAIQILGGTGYTDQARVGRIWRDCRGNQIAQGTDEVMVRVAAKFLMASRRIDAATSRLA